MDHPEITRRFNRVTMTWPGGEHTFALNIGELQALQDICNAGPPVVFSRISTGTWRVEDIQNALRLGLIGGGMPDIDAKHLVHSKMQEVPIMEFVLPAQIVLAAAMVGAKGEDEDDDDAAHPESPESGDDDAGNV